MTTLIELADKLEKSVTGLERAASDKAVRKALTIISSLAYSTPVDKSTAVSNWQVGLGAPVAMTIPAHFPGEHGSTFSASAAKTIEDAKLILAGKQPGVSIFISNPLPYIQVLNDGHSKQAPAGFVERAVLLGRSVE